MRKIISAVMACLLLGFVVSCSFQNPNVGPQTDQQQYIEYGLTSADIVQMDKEHGIDASLPFQVKVLTLSYITRKFQQLLGISPVGPVQSDLLLKELRYAKAKGADYGPIDQMYANNPGMYSITIADAKVIAYRHIDSGFDLWLTDLAP